MEQDSKQVTQFSIPEFRMEGVWEKIGKINKRAQKLGVEGVEVIELGREFVKEMKPDLLFPDGHMRKTGRVLVFHKIKLSVSQIKIAGYEFVATIQHTEAGNIVRQSPSFKGEVPEKFRTIETHCEHCKVKRSRKDTYLVSNGQFKQVGRSCLRDFLGHDVDAMISRYEWIQSLVGSLEEWESDGRSGRGGNYTGLDMEDYLESAAYFVKQYGWKPAAFESSSTAELTFSSFMSKEAERAEPGDKDKDLVKEALAWLETADKSNQYIANLQVAVKLGYVTGRTYRLVASLMGAYLRAMDQLVRQEKEKNRVKSQHVGKVGESLETEVVFKGSRTFDTMYGKSHLYMFEDKAGNEIRWFSGTNPGLEEGSEYQLKGRVKKHDRYRDIEQTIMTRCKIQAGAGE